MFRFVIATAFLLASIAQTTCADGNHVTSCQTITGDLCSCPFGLAWTGSNCVAYSAYGCVCFTASAFQAGSCDIPTLRPSKYPSTEPTQLPSMEPSPRPSNLPTTLSPSDADSLSLVCLWVITIVLVLSQ